MLSAQFIRENADRVRNDVALRNSSAPIDRIIELDDSRRSLLTVVENLRAELNVSSKAIGQTKEPAERQQRITSARDLGDRIALLDAELRTRMERLGLQRAASFGWSRAAQKTLDVYYDVADGRRSSVSRPEKRKVVPART